MTTTMQILAAAKQAVPALAGLTTNQKNEVLSQMADQLVNNSKAILAANSSDMQAASGSISQVMLDRLQLTPQRIQDMAQGLRQLIQLPDPVGQVLQHQVRPNGLCIDKVMVPLGVVAIIYESRPNVTADAAGLCLKSGNVCVLRCGKEAHATCNAIVNALQQALVQCNLPAQCINLVQDTSRDSANQLMRANGYVDLLIPRGGAGLINACVQNATVPCIQTGTGICHIYVDDTADTAMALNIIENAKTSRPSVCNAEEVCLVHQNIAPTFLPLLKQRLVDDQISKGKTPVELILDLAAATIIPGIPAGKTDFDTEFLDYKLAIAVVNDVNAAIAHVAAHSTHHSDAIVTTTSQNAQLFCNKVDSAAVYVNASTRFTDGGEFGLGCEMGISTQKLHARGPMGLSELCTYKYIIKGEGQIR